MSALNRKVRAVVADLVREKMIDSACPLKCAVDEGNYRSARLMLREMARGKNIPKLSGISFAPINSEAVLLYMARHDLRVQDLALFDVDWDTWKTVGWALLALLCVCGLLWFSRMPYSDPAVLREIEALRAEFQTCISRDDLQSIKDETQKELEVVRKQAASAEVAREQYMKHSVEVFVVDASQKRDAALIRMDEFLLNATQKQDAVLARMEVEGHRVMDNLTAIANDKTAVELGRLQAVVESANETAAIMLGHFNASLQAAAQDVQNRTEAFGETHSECMDHVDDLAGKTSVGLEEWGALHDRITDDQNRLAAHGEQIVAMTETLEKVQAKTSAVEKEQDTLRAAIGRAISVFQTFNQIGGPYALLVVVVIATSIAVAGWGYIAYVKAWTKVRRQEVYEARFATLTPSHKHARAMQDLQDRVNKLERRVDQQKSSLNVPGCPSSVGGISWLYWLLMGLVLLTVQNMLGHVTAPWWAWLVW